MSILDDLSSAIRQVHESAGPAVVGIGQGNRGSGVVIADGRVLTNAHNLRGDEVTVTFRDGRSERGKVLGVDPDGDLAVIEVATTGATALAVVRRRGRRSATSSSASPRPAPVPHASPPARSRPSSRPSGGPVAAGSAAASSTRRRWRRARPAGRSSTAPATSSRSTRIGSARASTWPAPRTQRSASGSMRSRAASRSAGRGWASRSRRRSSHGACVARSG